MPKILLDRQVLSEFLPNERAIKAFESLFELATETTPDSLIELEALIAGVRNQSSNIKNLDSRITELEQIRFGSSAIMRLAARVEELEQRQNKQVSLTDINSSIDELRQRQNRIANQITRFNSELDEIRQQINDKRFNPDVLLKRIQNIETFLGI